MNELERFIASLAPPGPGQELDQRIGKLLAGPARRTSPLQWKWHGAWLAAAAGLGMLGFFLGRQSVIVASQPTSVPRQVAVVSQPVREAERVGPPSTDARVMHVPLRHEHLASLFESFDSGEGMLGSGPLNVVVSKAP